MIIFTTFLDPATLKQKSSKPALQRCSRAIKKENVPNGVLYLDPLGSITFGLSSLSLDYSRKT
jgi:hypothetical protein